MMLEILLSIQMVTRNCRVVNKFVSVVLNEVKRTTRNKQFCCSQKFFFTIVSLICANQNICGLAQSLVVVKEKIIKKTTWQWQEQVSRNRRTMIILHIRKKIISALLWHDHCVIICCTTHIRARSHSRIGLNFFSYFLIRKLKRK